MTAKFKRDIRIVAGSLVIEPRTAAGENQPILRCKFDIMKNDNREVNKASLSIWNLKEENRTKLQEKDLEIVIEAGYVDEINQIFKGDIEHAFINREFVDWITALELGDGSKKAQSSTINFGMRGGQKPGAILKKAAEALGLDLGNVDEKVATNGVRSVLSEFINNVILNGKATDVLDEVASSMGLSYSIQDKKLNVFAKGEPLKAPAIQLNLGTGLIGSPQIGEEGIVIARSLLDGRIVPRQKIELESLITTGTFMAKSVHHTGDTWGDDWTTEVEMVQV